MTKVVKVIHYSTQSWPWDEVWAKESDARRHRGLFLSPAVGSGRNCLDHRRKSL